MDTVTHKGEIAAYRCQMCLPFSFVLESADDQIKNYSNQLSKKEIDALHVLKPYWRNTVFQDSLHRVSQFIATENNITEEAKKYFTYHPNGWKECISIHCEYEGVKFE